MEYPQLIKYIIDQEKKGVSRALVKESLITRGGWREDVVVQAFIAVDKEKMTEQIITPTPTPTPTPVSVATPSVSQKSDTVTLGPIMPKTISPIISPEIKTSTSVTTPITSNTVPPIQTPITVTTNSITVDKPMNPVEAQNKLSMIDALYSARATTVPPQTTPSVVGVSTTSSVTSSIGGPAMSNTKPFVGMPGNTDGVVFLEDKPRRSILKTIMKVIVGIIVIALLGAGVWFGYTYILKPKPSLVIEQGLHAFTQKTVMPYKATIDLKGIIDETGLAQSNQKIVNDGTYDSTKKEYTGSILLTTDDKETYGMRYLKKDDSTTIGGVVSDGVKTILDNKEQGLTFTSNEFDMGRGFVKKASPLSASLWDFSDAFVPLFEKSKSIFPLVGTYGTSLPDVTENGVKMRHVLLGADDIAKLSPQMKSTLSSLRASVQTVEVWTTWYPVTVVKVQATLVNKSENGLWKEGLVTIEFGNNPNAGAISFAQTETLADYINEQNKQEVISKQSAFYDAVFAQADLYKTTKKSYKGFCSVAKTGLQDLLLTDGLFTKNTVVCLDTIGSFSLSLPDYNQQDSFICKDTTSGEVVSLTTKPIKPTCK